MVAVPGHRRDEPVPAAGQRFDEPRGVGRVTQHFAQPVHRCAQSVVEVYEGVPGPESLTQFVASHQLTGTLDERGKHLDWLPLQCQADAGLAEFARVEVDLEDAKADEASRRGGVEHKAPRIRQTVEIDAITGRATPETGLRRRRSAK